MLRNAKGQTYEEFLKEYDANRFEKPSCTVDMLLFTVENKKELNYRKLPEKAFKILMVERADFPYMGDWALPGGFVNVEESLDTAALRELKEETNIENVYMEQLYTWGDVNRDPRTRVISTSYMALVDSSKLDIKAGDDASDAKWFEIKKEFVSENVTTTDNSRFSEKVELLTLSNGEITLSAHVKTTTFKSGCLIKQNYEVLDSCGIAFDHAKIIVYGLERLRNKIEYTNIAFNLMPDLFTLTELQQVYELILDKELLKANFRRKIQGMVRETNEMKIEAGHRPAKLFTYNEDWGN